LLHFFLLSSLKEGIQSKALWFKQEEELVTVPLYRNASIILMGVLEAKKEFITAI
jgi:hypothetical protein